MPVYGSNMHPNAMRVVSMCLPGIVKNYIHVCYWAEEVLVQGLQQLLPGKLAHDVYVFADGSGWHKSLRGALCCPMVELKGHNVVCAGDS